MDTYEWSAPYTDICKEIEMLEIRKDELQGELRIMQRKMTAGPRTKLVASYSGMPNGEGADTPIPQMWSNYNTISEELDIVLDILDLKLEAKQRMEKSMGGMISLERQVAYKRDIERKPLEKIAEELNYTYNWIAKVSARTKRLRLIG